MEDVPPSYEAATNRDVWTVVAPWIPSHDLCAASLVSRRWHDIFAPFLWGDPASHFGTENDAVYVALTRFKRTLKRARLGVRQLTHTLHLPPALSEIYGGPNAFWLRDVLNYLPNLQSLIVSRLPFFDHQSLVALKQVRRSSTSGTHRPSRSNEEAFRPVLQYDGLGRQFPLSTFNAPHGQASGEEVNQPGYYELKLLIATKELNSTSAGLVEAIRHFPRLVYLDLSYTSPARDAAVLYALRGLGDLQVLKLRGIGLRDSEAEVLANAIATRVRVLDIRDNILTDMAIRSLLQACFLSRGDDSAEIGSGLEDWPIGLPPGPDMLSLDALRGEDLDQQLLRQLTKPLTGRLAFEDIPHKGLTHLYVSGNRLSVEGLYSVLKPAKLHVLDSGSVDTAKTLTRTRSSSSPGRYIDEISFPGAEKIVPVLSAEAGKKLTYLRANHAIITSKPSKANTFYPLASPAEPVAELPDTSTTASELLASTHQPLELSAKEQIFELPAEPLKRKAELPGDIIHFAISPPVNDAPSSDEATSASLVIRRGSGVFAPEPVDDEGPTKTEDPPDTHVVSVAYQEEGKETGFNATGTGLSSKRTNRPPSLMGTTNPSSLVSTNTTPRSVPSPSVVRQAKIQELLQKRPKLLTSSATSMSSFPHEISFLHPSAMPHLRTLVLTDVPSHVPASSSLPGALKSFISACADEAHLSLLLAQTDYSLPPGRSRAASELRHARSLFALEALVLEIDDVSKDRPVERQGGTTWRHAGQRDLFSKSSTGDRDTEAFWAAAEGDFSFFGEEGEAEDECGIYRTDPGKYHFTNNGADGMIAVADEEREDRDMMFTGMDAVTSRISGRAGPAELHGALPPSIGRDGTRQPKIPINSQVVKKKEELVDVIAILSAFRKAKKTEFEAAMSAWYDSRSHDRSIVSPRTPLTPFSRTTVTLSTTRLADIPFVPGYWKGEVRVVRQSSSASSGPLDQSIQHHRHHSASSLTGGMPRPQLSPTTLPTRLRSNSNGSGTASSTSLSACDSRSSALVAREREQEGTTTVDYYGNRFEGGYLYP